MLNNVNFEDERQFTAVQDTLPHWLIGGLCGTNNFPCNLCQALLRTVVKKKKIPTPYTGSGHCKSFMQTLTVGIRQKSEVTLLCKLLGVVTSEAETTSTRRHPRHENLRGYWKTSDWLSDSWVTSNNYWFVLVSWLWCKPSSCLYCQK